jgi:hypothetical protein
MFQGRVPERKARRQGADIFSGNLIDPVYNRNITDL